MGVGTPGGDGGEDTPVAPGGEVGMIPFRVAPALSLVVPAL